MDTKAVSKYRSCTAANLQSGLYLFKFWSIVLGHGWFRDRVPRQLFRKPLLFEANGDLAKD